MNSPPYTDIDQDSESPLFSQLSEFGFPPLVTPPLNFSSSFPSSSSSSSDQPYSPHSPSSSLSPSNDSASIICPLHTRLFSFTEFKTRVKRPSPYTFLRMLMSSKALFPEGSSLPILDETDGVERIRRLSEERNLLSMDDCRRLCLDTRAKHATVFQSKESMFEALQLAGCICIEPLDSSKRPRHESSGTASDDSLSSRVATLEYKVEEIETKLTLVDCLQLYLNEQSFLQAAEGRADLCYWYQTSESSLQPGTIVSVCNGFVSLQTTNQAFLTAIPQRPWLHVRKPANPDGWTGVAVLGHVDVLVETLPADFHYPSSTQYYVFPSGKNDGVGVISPLQTAEETPVGCIMSEPRPVGDSTGRNLWSVSIFVRPDIRPSTGSTIQQRFRREGHTSLSIIPPEKVFDRSVLIDELVNSMKELLASTSASSPLLLLHGLAGVGKTALAVDLTNHSNIPSLFPSGVWIRVRV
jgi:hypothetical protein